MKYFCKGALVGVITGMLVGAVVVVKNKKLANGIKENLEKAEKKVSETAQKVMKKIKEKKQEKENQEQNSQNNANLMSSGQENFGNCCSGSGESSNQNCNCGG